MKIINVIFDDDEFKLLLAKKGKLTWREYILQLPNEL